MTVAMVSIGMAIGAIVGNCLIWRDQRRMSRSLDAWERELGRMEQELDRMDQAER